MSLIHIQHILSWSFLVLPLLVLILLLIGFLVEYLRAEKMIKKHKAKLRKHRVNGYIVLKDRISIAKHTRQQNKH